MPSCCAIKPVGVERSGSGSGGIGTTGEIGRSVACSCATGEAPTAGSVEGSFTRVLWAGGRVRCWTGGIDRLGGVAVMGGVSVDCWFGTGVGTIGSGVGAGGGGSSRKSRNSGGVFVPAS